MTADRGGRQLHRLEFGGDRRHRTCDRCQAGADDQVDLVLGDEAARVAHALARIGGIVQHDQVDLFAGDFLGEQLELVGHRDAEAGARARQRQADADVDVGQRGAGGGQGHRGGDEGTHDFHGVSFRLFAFSAAPFGARRRVGSPRH
jgi:hypothetical protein